VSWVGKVISGRYRLMQVVGKGAHGLVYRGVDRDTDADVAVKVIHTGVAHQTELETRMEREYEALKALAGSAATRVHGLLREEGALCLVMEFLRGQDFDEYLADIEEQGRLIDPATLIEFLDPIAETLEKAHELGILHRDLKPGNIFIPGRGGPGGVRLLDFGLSRSGSSAPITLDGVVIGSPSYIAPEVWEGNPRALDHRIDVYSFGAIIFRALAGRVPFPVKSMREKLDAARTARRPSLHAVRPDLAPSIDNWVEKALAIDRNDRFERIRSMWETLLAALHERPPRRTMRAGTPARS
jgi:eukaryotic-like serine/threonine-protein kinase